MSCGDYRPMITGYLDGELPPPHKARLEEHLASCSECARELAELAELKKELSQMEFKEPTDEELERYWRGVYNRLERGVGWALVSVGAILVLCWGAFQLIEEMMRDPDVALALKVGVVALVIGAVILFVSILRERLALSKVDRYSREVKR